MLEKLGDEDVRKHPKNITVDIQSKCTKSPRKVFESLV